MLRRLKRSLPVLLVAVGVIVCIVSLLWSTTPPAQEPVAPTPSMSVPSVSSQPSEVPGKVSPTATPSQKTLSNPRGEPTKLTIRRGNTVVVTPMAFAPRVVSSDGWFSSQSGYVAWWDAKTSSPKPGELSPYISLITGHVIGRGQRYPLKNLMPDSNGNPGGRKGDLLYIQYSSGDMVVARAVEDSHDVVKTELNKLPEYTMNGGKQARTIRLTTCDRTGTIRVDGHAKHNVVQRFTVVDIIKY